MENEWKGERAQISENSAARREEREKYRSKKKGTRVERENLHGDEGWCYCIPS